jgi:polar amino acid transport system substrate-binding protein
MKLNRRNLLLAASSLCAVLALGVSNVAPAATTFDLSPEQHGRLHAGPDASAIKLVPPGFKFAEDGVLTIGITVAFPPLSSYATDSKTIVGVDPDLSQLLADSLGRKLKLVPLAWEDWPLAVASGKVDAVLSNVTVTDERKEKFDFSSYRRDVLGFYVPLKSGIRTIGEPKDVAGLRVISDSGTNQEKILLNWSKIDVEHGLKPVQILYYDDYAVRDVALQSGRADAILSVNSALAYAAAQKGDLRRVGTISGGWPITAEVAVVTRKGHGLAVPVTQALNDLIRDGKYRQTLDRWELGVEAIDAARTNPPGLPKN